MSMKGERRSKYSASKARCEKGIRAVCQEEIVPDKELKSGAGTNLYIYVSFGYVLLVVSYFFIVVV